MPERQMHGDAGSGRAVPSMRVARCPDCGDERLQVISRDGTLGECYGGACVSGSLYPTSVGKRKIKALREKQNEQ